MTDNAIISYRDADIECEIIEVMGEFILFWNDGVANEWSETYELLSIAVSRLASLIACGEANWEVGFVTTPVSHVEVAQRFIDESLGR